MKANPNAPKGALRFEDLRSGLNVVVVRGGSGYHERLLITSRPYPKDRPIVDSNRSDAPRLVQSWAVLAVSYGAVDFGLEDEALGPAGEYNLLHMGLCPDPNGRWSSNYTVPLSYYRAHEHE